MIAVVVIVGVAGVLGPVKQGRGSVVAVLKPTFTTAAYYFSVGGGGNVGFYNFYSKYGTVPFGVPITTDLDWLSLDVPKSYIANSGWGNSYQWYLAVLANATRSNQVLTVLTDENLTAAPVPAGIGTLYVSHEEYVTAQEAANLKEFVASGGTLVLDYGDELEVLVTYTGHTESLVLGHGFSFDGKVAYRSNATDPSNRPFQAENKNWVGSSFQATIFAQTGVEADNLLNTTGTIVFKDWHFRNSVTGAPYSMPPGVEVAYYSHSYKKGTVICLCRNWPATASQAQSQAS